MAIDAKDVMRLRTETSAPVMECRTALEEAGGDFSKAKDLLREKGKASAAKRSDRATGAGVVAFSASPDAKTVGGVVLECETDFVAKNSDFVELAQQIADKYRDQDPGSEPMNVQGIRELVEDAVAKIRENIKVGKAIRLTSTNPIATYVHHDRTKGAAIVFDGQPATDQDAIRKVAIQVVASPPEVISREQLSQEKIAAEIETETKRAINEGKDEKMARNIATGRVNKEFVKQAVLLEQPFYIDQSKSVGQYLQESAKGTTVSQFVYLTVGGA